MEIPKRTKYLLIALGITAFLTSFLFIIPKFMPTPKLPVSEARAEGDPHPEPKLAIPAQLKYPFTAQILETVNISLAEMQDTSTGYEHKRRNPGLFKLRASF